ncbi:MAG: SdrD B-like domain-containing protein [Minisyncoccia bacterium]
MQNRILTKALTPQKIRTGVIATGLSLLLFIFTMGIARADVAPTITTEIHNGSHGVVTSVPVGSLVHANANVASTSGPTATGFVDFSFYPNTTCTGGATVQTGVVLALGIAESATTTVISSGLSYKVHYNGLTDTYLPVDGQCQVVSATALTTTLGITLSTTTTLVGNSVYASSTLSNSTTDAGGTVAYNVYTNNSCTTGTQSAGSKTVTSGIVPVSNSLVFNTVGSFYFQAVYSGDLNNSPATSTCQNGVVDVLTTTIPTTPGTGSISGKLYHDLNRNRTLDTSEPGLAGRTIKLYNNPGWWGKTGKAPFASATTDSSGNYTFLNLADGVYSIEEINVKGFNQITSDYRSVSLTGGAQLTGYDFADATSTKKIGKDKDHDGRRHGQGDDHKEVKKQDKQDNKFIQSFKKFRQMFNKWRSHGGKN